MLNLKKIQDEITHLFFHQKEALRTEKFNFKFLRKMNTCATQFEYYVLFSKIKDLEMQYYKLSKLGCVRQQRDVIGCLKCILTMLCDSM